MAGFEDLYRMQQGRNNPLLNLQQMQVRMPNWLTPPTPQNSNLGSTGMLLGQMNRFGDVERQQQRLDIERQRAKDMADIQMRTFQAEMARNKQAQEARKTYAEANPDFAPGIMAGEDPTDFQRKMASVGNDPAKYREVYGPGPGVTVNAGNQFAAPPKGMVRVPDADSATGTKLVAESGAPKAKISDVELKNRSIAKQNQQLGKELQTALTNEDGSPNQQAIASMKISGTTLNKMLNLFAQNETYLKSGAAAGEQETAKTKGAMEPGALELLFGDDPLSGIRRSTEYAAQRIGSGSGPPASTETAYPSGWRKSDAN